MIKNDVILEIVEARIAADIVFIVTHVLPSQVCILQDDISMWFDNLLPLLLQYFTV